MVTIGIQGIPKQLQSMALGSSSRTSSTSVEELGFGDYFKQSIQTKSSNDRSESQVSSKDGENKLDYTSASSEKANQSNDVSKVDTTKTDATKADSNEKIESENEVEVPEEVLSQQILLLLQAVDEVKQSLLNECDVTEAELTQVLETNGYTLVDLLEPNNLKEVFLQLQGEDSSALLTNELLKESLQGLQELAMEVNPLTQTPLTQEETNLLLEHFQTIMNESNEDMAMEQPKVELSDLVSEEVEAVETADVSKTVVSEQQKDEGNMQQSSSDEHMSKKEVSKEVQVTVNGQIETSTQTKVDFMEQFVSNTMSKEIVDQIVQEVKVNISVDKTSMELVLTPETLGRVNLTVTSKNGIMTAHLVTETEVAKEAIESQLNVLKETLQNQGLKVESVEVTVAPNNFDFMNQSQGEQQNQAHQEKVKKSIGRLHMVGEEVEETEETVSVNVEASMGKGTNIDLTA